MRDIRLGQGMPKICVPIVETTQEMIWKAAEKLSASAADLVEWRADYYEDLLEPDRLQETVEGFGRALGEKALLFTIRTSQEGGEKQISFTDYAAILKTVAGFSAITYIDVEMFWSVRGSRENLWPETEHSCYAPVRDLVSSLRQQVTVIGSYHDFQKTPPAAEITQRLAAMHELGADIPKMAVMPQKKEDVLHLMAATWAAKQLLDPVPIITMSMGRMGAVSRVAGESFGSAVTFGCTEKASAPGQIEVNALKQILQVLHG